MLSGSMTRWGGLIGALVLIAGALVHGWRTAGPGEQIEIPVELVARLGALPPEKCSPVLTDIYDRLAESSTVRQVLLLQAIPAAAPVVVATAEDSSGDEEATHWPSPWAAVNTALASGRLPAQIMVPGRQGGFDYCHWLVPVDETNSRVLLINQAAPAPGWNLPRILMLCSGVFVAGLCWITRS